MTGFRRALLISAAALLAAILGFGLWLAGVIPQPSFDPAPPAPPPAAVKSENPGEAASFPEEMREIWAIRDCAAPTLVHVYAEQFALTASAGGSSILRLGPGSGPVEDYFHVQNNFTSYDLRRARDGARLLQYIEPSKREALAGNPFVNEKDWRLLAFARCEGPPAAWPHLSAPGGLDAFRALDGIYAICGDAGLPDNPGCRDALFARADGNGDGRLDNEELAALYRQTAFLAASNSCQFSLYFPSGVGEAGKAFAAAVMKSAGGEGGLALTEIIAAWPRLEGEEGLQLFLRMAKSLSPLLPFLPPGEVLPGCKSCVPAE